MLGVAQKSRFLFKCPFFAFSFETIEPDKGGHFQKSNLLRVLKHGTRTFLQNLKFPKYHVPAIQKMLILS